MKEQNSDESRLDRIEKSLELLIQGALELRGSQEKTDEQLQRTDEQILQLRESQKKTDEQILQLKESQKETDVLLKKTIKKLGEIGRQLGDLGLVQGEVAEDLFYRNIRNLFKSRNLTFKYLKRNLKKKDVGEYDIVAADGDAVLVIEVKNKLAKRMVDDFIKEKLPKFKEAFPQYSEYRLLGGIGALVVKDSVGRYAEKAGLYVLTQTSEGGATLINKKNFQAKEFS